MQREVDMDMIVMKNIGAGAKHRGEWPAGAGMDVLQEGPRLIIAPCPIADDQNLAPVGEAETADVEGIAKGMFGNVPARLVVHGPAAVGAHRLDLNHRRAETRQRGGLDDLRQPRIERGDHWAVERIDRIETHRAIE
jgi:hypothetical protein